MVEGLKWTDRGRQQFGNDPDEVFKFRGMFRILQHVSFQIQHPHQNEKIARISQHPFK